MAKKSNIKTITPMYAVGDWVVDERSGKTKQIITVDKALQTYYFNDCTFIEFQLESQLHLWSIFDAQDGEILIKDSSEHKLPYIAIFKQDYTLSVEGAKYTTYCYHGYDGKLHVDTGEECLNGVLPAAAKEGVKLFKAIRKAGYDWDATNKVLTKKRTELEEEIEKCMVRHNMLAVGKRDFTEIATYFYELGLKAKEK